LGTAACVSSRPPLSAATPTPEAQRPRFDPLPPPYGVDGREVATNPSYVPQGLCGGLPRIKVSTAPGFCVGVVDAGVGLRFPRGIAEVAPGVFVLVDMGGWAQNLGRVFLLKRNARGAYERTLLIDAARLLPAQRRWMDRPNAAVLGPDGKVYIGAAGTIFRFRPLAPRPLLTIEGLVDDLPNTGRHPLKSLAFDAEGSLYVNVGSISDNCEASDGRNPDPALPCAEADGEAPRGVIRKYRFDAQRLVRPGFEVIARGLRNSMSLAVHPVSGELYQGENSRDYINQKDPSLNDELSPPEELNVIEAGQHYGWPYCHGRGLPAPEYPRADCSGYREGLLLWPAHAAPLSMFFVARDNPLLPVWYRGKLVVAFHGYRQFGHRIVVFDADAQGRPTGLPREIVYGWDARGPQPVGAPTAMAVAHDGSIFVTEDKNRTVLRVFYNRRAGNGLPRPGATSAGETPVERAWREARAARREPYAARLRANAALGPSFTQIQERLIHKSCLNCHAGPYFAVVPLLEFDDIGNARRLLAPRENGRPALVIPGRPDDSEFLARLESRGVAAKMPPMGFGDAQEGHELSQLVREWIAAGAPVPTDATTPVEGPPTPDSP
jgi:glucose/arabinose dehydrogenase